MIKKIALYFFLMFSQAQAAIIIQGGDFIPLYGLGKDEKKVTIRTFKIDPMPVTNKEYFEFIQKNPRWKKNNVKEVFADKKYLEHWNSSDYVQQNPNKPVVFVSWFAAQEFCESKGGRLPSVYEWEYVASADEKNKNASQDPKFKAKILEWYSQPNQQLVDVGLSKPNYYKVYDLHGSIWEWTYDFNTVFVTGDNRQDGDSSKNMFCGNSSNDSSDRENYAGFMRYAMRSSLRANFNLANLGFRCVYEVKL